MGLVTDTTREQIGKGRDMFDHEDQRKLPQAAKTGVDSGSTRKDIARRTFLSGAVGVAAASYVRILGANDTLQLGVIGVGDRGRWDM